MDHSWILQFGQKILRLDQSPESYQEINELSTPCSKGDHNRLAWSLYPEVPPWSFYTLHFLLPSGLVPTRCPEFETQTCAGRDRSPWNMGSKPGWLGRLCTRTYARCPLEQPSGGSSGRWTWLRRWNCSWSLQLVILCSLLGGLGFACSCTFKSRVLARLERFLPIWCGKEGSWWPSDSVPCIEPNVPCTRYECFYHSQSHKMWDFAPSPLCHSRHNIIHLVLAPFVQVFSQW